MYLRSLIFVSGVLFASGIYVVPVDYSTFTLPFEKRIDLPASDYKQRSTCDMIERHGYRNKTYHVTTKDGYVLELHRIPYDSERNSEYKGVVFLMHGLQSSSADWVVLGPEKGLAFVLADQGYDVWMGNARGNKYSRNHISYNPEEDKSFWDFSWHEIGVIDLPTMIDYVLEKTDESQLTYIGHSQGTTSFFVMASELPEYNKKIKIMHAFAPVVFLKHANNLVLKFASVTMNQPYFYKWMGVGEFLPTSELLSRIGDVTCRDKSLTQSVCKNTYFICAGYDPSNLNKTILPDLMQNVPAGCATKQIVHYSQNAYYGLISLGATPKFEKFDYGSRENTRRYGQQAPPKYDLKKVTCKVALYVGEKDNLATPQDVKHLSGILPNVVSHYKIAHQNFLHVDFVWGQHVDRLLYDKMFSVMSEHVQ